MSCWKNFKLDPRHWRKCGPFSLFSGCSGTVRAPLLIFYVWFTQLYQVGLHIVVICVHEQLKDWEHRAVFWTVQLVGLWWSAYTNRQYSWHPSLFLWGVEISGSAACGHVWHLVSCLFCGCSLAVSGRKYLVSFDILPLSNAPLPSPDLDLSCILVPCLVSWGGACPGGVHPCSVWLGAVEHNIRPLMEQVYNTACSVIT